MKVTPLRSGDEPPAPAPYRELREKLDEQRTRALQAKGVMDTLHSTLFDDDNTTAQACGAAAAVLELVADELDEVVVALQRGEVKP